MTGATTAQGSDNAIRIASNGVLINDAKVNTTDIQASNGVIQVIDTVVFPAS